MSLPYLSLSQARCLHLAAQGLLKKPRRNALPGDVLAAISRMALLQIDTINVVARRAPIWCCLAVSAHTHRPGWMRRGSAAS